MMTYDVNSSIVSNVTNSIVEVHKSPVMIRVQMLVKLSQKYSKDTQKLPFAVEYVAN